MEKESETGERSQMDSVVQGGGRGESENKMI